MRLPTLILMAAGFQAFSLGQDWIRQNPLPVGAATRIMDVSMVNADTVFVAGQNGEIGRTEDGGATWKAQYAGTDSALNSVSFVNGQLGWVAGAGGFIARTTDGGATWEPQQSGTAFSLNKIQFLTPADGFIVGDSGTVLRTADSGRTWEVMSRPAAGNLQALFFVNAATGWVGGDGVLARTDNGGNAWALQGPTNLVFRALSFISPDTGFAAESFGMVYRTVDGGAAWTQLYNFPTADIFWLYDLHFTDGLNGWAIGAFQMSGTNNDGRVMRTRNGGAAWTRQLQTEQTLLAGAFSDTLNGWCVGLNGTLFKTADGGGSWSNELKGVTASLYSVCFTDSLHGWAAGGSNFDSSVVLRTVNGGRTWIHQATPVRSARLKSVMFIDRATGWAAGDNGRLMKTIDSGATWTALSSPSAASDYNQVFFINSSYGWAVAGNSLASGAAARTRDGGANWTAVTLPVTRPMEGVFFFDTSAGFLVGWGGTILRTRNGGQSWTGVGDSSFGNLMDVRFMDRARGWITGDHKILMTSDSGATWQVWHEEGLSMTHAFFTDTSTGYAVAYSLTSPFPGYILKTVDGGRNWQRKRIADGMIYSGGIHFVDGTTGWVASSGGAILKTVLGGGIDWSIPEVRVLSPAGGEVWSMGEIRPVAWTATDDTVIISRSIWLSIDGGKSFKLMDSAAGSRGSWDWNIFADTASSRCVIEVRVVDAEGYVGKARSGPFSITGTGVERGGAPGPEGLLVVHPNPFNPGVGAAFPNPRADARVAVYDVSGRIVKCVEKVKTGGLYLDFSGLGRGLYVIRVQSDGRRYQRTITFIH